MIISTTVQKHLPAHINLYIIGIIITYYKKFYVGVQVFKIFKRLLSLSIKWLIIWFVKCPKIVKIAHTISWGWILNHQVSLYCLTTTPKYKYIKIALKRKVENPEKRKAEITSKV